jgi:hypothetical protein
VTANRKTIQPPHSATPALPFPYLLGCGKHGNECPSFHREWFYLQSDQVLMEEGAVAVVFSGGSVSRARGGRFDGF